MSIQRPLLACCFIGFALGCGPSQSTNDAGDNNPGSDSGVDAGTPSDAGKPSDAGMPSDAGTSDAGLPDAGTDAGHAVNVCGAASGSLAWSASIPAATTTLVPTDIVAGPTTNDVVVGDIRSASTFEQYRWDSSGNLLGTHQDAKGAYAGTMFPSNLVIDGQNDLFYGLVLTGLPEAANTGALLTFERLAPDGTPVFSQPEPNALPTSSSQQSVEVFQAGHDTGGNLHATLKMTGDTPYFQAAVYCWAADGTDLGPSAQSLAATLSASDFLWPSLDANLYLAQSLTASTSVGSSPSCPVTVPAGGATVLGKFGGGGSCSFWTPIVLALPTAAIQQRVFRQGADGSLSFAVVYSGTIDFGGGALSSSGTNSLALARFDSGGNLQWTKNFGGAGSSFKLGSLDTNSNGVTILTAGYVGTVNLGGGVLPANADTFLAVFESTGSLKWSRQVTVGSSGQLLAAAGPCGLVLATNSPSVDLGSGPLSTISPPSSATIGVAALGL